jgi:hypothetical protein
VRIIYWKKGVILFSWGGGGVADSVKSVLVTLLVCFPNATLSFYIVVVTLYNILDLYSSACNV